ncbi:MAG: ComF family protein [Clostridiales bacterium]|nr:ComF family protein [Clostridiales bacterium]
MNLIMQAADILLPYRCGICGGCSDASGKIGQLEAIYGRLYGEAAGIHVCGKCLSELVPQPRDRRWFTCLSNPLNDDPAPDLTLYVPFSYSGVVDKAVPRIKFSGRYEIARLFGILLAAELLSEGIEFDMIVPVPLNPKRFKERGFNQAFEIAYPVSRLSGRMIADNVLLRNKETRRQSELIKTQDRMLNVSGAFAFNPEWDITGNRVLLIDDVATSGHTLRECALTLLGNGADSVLCCAFAGNRQIKNDEPF